MNTLKELAVVQYGESGVRLLPGSHRDAGQRCFSLHWHDRMELLRVTQGGLELFLGEEHAASVQAGQAAVIAPCQPHMAVAGADGVTYNVIMFEVDTFYNAAPITSRFLRPLREGRIPLAPSSDDAALVAALDALSQKADDSPLEAVGEVYRVLHQLMRTCAEPMREPSASDLRFAAVVDYVNEHYTEPLSTGALCRLFGYEEAYFCRRFKKATGLTVLRYIEVLRLEAAQKLLMETDADVSRIALQCGFGDVCYFSHRFHRHAGLSPTAFRKGGF